jgi:hypothetical protein
VSETQVKNWQPWAREWGIPDEPEKVTAYFLDAVLGVFTLGPGGVVMFDGEPKSGAGSFMSEGVGGPDQDRPFYPDDGVDFLRALLLRNRTSSYYSYVATSAMVTREGPAFE